MEKFKSISVKRKGLDLLKIIVLGILSGQFYYVLKGLIYFFRETNTIIVDENGILIKKSFKSSDKAWYTYDMFDGYYAVSRFVRNSETKEEDFMDYFWLVKNHELILAIDRNDFEDDLKMIEITGLPYMGALTVSENESAEQIRKKMGG